jgi:hypothetical protein
MDCCSVSGPRHQSIEDVELANKVPLSDAADRGVARHLAYVLCSKGEQANTRTAPGRGSRGFASGMAGTDHQNVVHGRRLHDRCFT